MPPGSSPESRPLAVVAAVAAAVIFLVRSVMLDKVLFTVVALLPLGIALLVLLVAPSFTQPRLIRVRGWIERHGQRIIAIVLLGLAVSLVRDGIAGFTA